MEIQISYAADDSCMIKLWCKGHQIAEEFLIACSEELEMFDGRIQPLKGFPVKKSYYRTQMASSELSSYGVCDFIFKESEKGRGAYPVTILDIWLPLKPRRDENDNYIPVVIED